MIVFDYGHTLAYEPGFDGSAAQKALLSLANSNKNCLTSEEINEFSDRLFADLTRRARKNHVEIHQHMVQRFLYEYLGIEFTLSQTELEKIFWDSAAPGTGMPNAEKVIDYINGRGIRSGVISNISFSGQALKDRLDRLFPNNRFEFILASSEYIYRKPDPMIFRLALKKAGLTGGDVWYCGDTIKYDVLGAQSAGIFPVLYRNELECYYRETEYEAIPDCPCLQISDWQELIELLDTFV
jgi:putative hydrolase of the HAD superfamily